eukprot:364912-Chlamydomonas_euryale.AAC.21
MVTVALVLLTVNPPSPITSKVMVLPVVTMICRCDGGCKEARGAGRRREKARKVPGNVWERGLGGNRGKGEQGEGGVGNTQGGWAVCSSTGGRRGGGGLVVYSGKWKVDSVHYGGRKLSSQLPLRPHRSVTRCRALNLKTNRGRQMGSSFVGVNYTTSTLGAPSASTAGCMLLGLGGMSLAPFLSLLVFTVAGFAGVAFQFDFLAAWAKAIGVWMKRICSL